MKIAAVLPPSGLHRSGQADYLPDDSPRGSFQVHTMDGIQTIWACSTWGSTLSLSSVHSYSVPRKAPPTHPPIACSPGELHAPTWPVLLESSMHPPSLFSWRAPCTYLASLFNDSVCYTPPALRPGTCSWSPLCWRNCGSTCS